MLTRREFLVVSAAITASRAYDASAQQPASSAKPNILFILADDLGWGDLSCYGLYRPRFRGHRVDGNCGLMIGAAGLTVPLGGVDGATPVMTHRARAHSATLLTPAIR